MSTKTAIVLAAALGTASASAEVPHTKASALARVDDNLARLRALRVVFVGDLVVQPGESAAHAAEQLEAFTEIAEAAVRKGPSAAAARSPKRDAVMRPSADQVALYLNQLRFLEVVEIGDLIEQRPSRSGRCWGACPEDRATADAVNAARAEKLQRIAAAELAARHRLVDDEGE
jgi:hypothetical protein